ncbi:hypothetical protein CDL12_29075 [Handroanthus impetiginosus]|uniref:AP2/ERF domain-containing protein n=1 Tax=Handroanthus impetiginosus TaxID=429701 RepID=A0A2G9FZF5_9LAMI|nr:hypothetical protein CDL12_29075 [Handroanthus impetiginosus]
MLKTAADSSSSSSAAAINAVEPRVNELKYKGVRKRKWGKYVSEIRLPNSRDRIWLGSYDTAEKAARAFDAALFCLRGRNAQFNFPDDPPDIPGGETLAPVEIQSVAQQYANQPRESDLFRDHAIKVEDEPPSSNSDGPGPIDWSFLDTLGTNGGGNNAGHFSDYGHFYPEPSDMFIPPNFGAQIDDDEDDDFEDGNLPSFLWNF